DNEELGNDYHEEGHLPPQDIARHWCDTGVAAVRRDGARVVSAEQDTREANQPFGRDVCAKWDDYEQMDASPRQRGILVDSNLVVARALSCSAACIKQPGVCADSGAARRRPCECEH